MSDEPLQLIKFQKLSEASEKTVAHLDSDVVDRILRQCGDLPVCIVCICGPSRRGKSFILGYMIRYFEALETGQKDWIDSFNPTKPLSGFRFENRVEPLTKGIWIWSRPFIVSSGIEKIAVLLVDTQGTGDEYTTEIEMTTIVSLSLLFSSMMIFNFFTTLDEKTLGAFDIYIQYGLLALENDDREGKPFQSNLFLIRDWNVPCEYPYGREGGQAYLRKLLEPKQNQSDEAQRVRKSIQDCFEETSCFLMPYIGEKAKTNTFTGSISELDREFTKQLENFIGNYLNMNNLVKKKVLGETLTAPDLRSYLETYVKIFNSGEIPQAINVWEATVQASNGNLVAKALRAYVEGMKNTLEAVGEEGYLPENLLNETHNREKVKAQNLFENAKKFGTIVECEEFSQRLLSQIGKEVKQISTENEMKRREFIFKAEENAKEELLEKLTDAFPHEVVGEHIPFFYEAEEISQFAKNVIAQVSESFERKFNLEPERVRKSLLQKLKNILNEMLRDFLTNNQLQKGKADAKISSLQKQLVADHNREVKEFLEHNEFARVEILEEIHGQFKSEKIAAFVENSSPKSDSTLEISFNHHHHQKHREYLEKSRNDLEITLEKEYENLSNSHKLHLSEVSSIMEGIVEELIENYIENLGNYISTACESQKDLKIYHESISTSILAEFNEKQNPYPESNQERYHFSEKLEKGLNYTFESSKMKLEQDIRALDDIYREAIKDCGARYEEKMGRFLKDEATSLEELEVAHFQFLDEETKLLEEAVDLKIDLNQNQAVRQANLPGYVENLKSSVTPIFDLIKMKLALLQDEAKALAMGWKLECKTLYENIMKENLEMAEDMENLQSFHKAATLFAGEALMDKMTDEENRHVSFDVLASELESELETKWIEFQSKFEDKLKAKLAELKEILGQAQEHYNREMETHFLNNQFIRPDYLEELHKAAVSVAISKLGGESDSKLSSEITSALDKFLSDFQTRNDMNLNLKFKPAIGIDLGTTNCCVGVYKNGEVSIIPAKDRDNFKTTPSYVSFNDEGTKCVAYGHAAKDLFYINQKTTIFDVKRIIGKPMSDPLLQKDTETWPFKVTAGERGQPMIQVGREGNLHTPSGISALLLARLRESTEEFLMLPKMSIKKAVITVPAYFDNDQRQATVDAGTIAGFDKVDLLSEPVAAIFAYKMDKRFKSAKKVLIYDLGGGTFDVAVIDVESGINVLAIGGDKHLGGEDFDRRLMEYCVKEFSAKTKIKILTGNGKNGMQGLDERTVHRLRRLQARCEIAKKNLSSAESAVVSMDTFVDEHEINVKVSREEFEKQNEADFQETIKIVDETVESVKAKIPGFRKEDIDDVILIGGSTRIPRVRHLLQEYFGGNKALNISINPDEAVAYGAARQAAILNGADAKGQLDLFAIQDITPLSLGTQIVTKEMSIIVPRHTKIPCKHHHVYCTARDNQTGMLIDIFQGEKKIAEDNRLLGKFNLSGLPPRPAGSESVDIGMDIDSMGILHVTAVSKSISGVRGELTISEESQRIPRAQLPKLRVETFKMLMEA